MFPLPPLPPIPGWIKDQLSDLGDFANPFIWFAKALAGVYHLLAWFLEQLLVNPPRFQADKVTDYLYGNALGLAGYTIMVVTIVLLCVSMFYTRKVLSALEALVIAIAISILGPFWFGMADSAITFGDKLAQLAMFYDPPGKNSSLLGITLQGVENPLLLIAAFLPTVLTAGLVTCTIFIYELLNLALKVLVLPALALRPLGDGWRAFSDWTFSAFLVSAVFGRALFVFFIELGQLAGNTLAWGTDAGYVFFLNAGLLAGLYMQFVLFKQARRVVGRVSGNTRSKVFGKVDATLNKPAKVDPIEVKSRSAGTLKVSETHAKTPRTHQKVVAQGRDYVKQQTKSVVYDKVATGFAAKAATAAAAGASGGTVLALGAVAKAAESAKKRADFVKDKPLARSP